MKTARTILVSILGVCLVASFFSSIEIEYQGTYLGTDGKTSLMKLSPEGRGYIYQTLSAGIPIGNVKWKKNNETQTIEVKHEDGSSIHVMLVSKAKEQGFPVQGNNNDLIQVLKEGNTTSFSHIATKVDSDSLEYKMRAASVGNQ